MKPVGRRRFLTWTATSAALATGVFALARTRGYPQPPSSWQPAVLAPWEIVVIEAVGARVLAPESASIAAYVDATLTVLPAADRRAL
ncbi:MAG: hypothetical protein JW751_15580 [Polyangiaceae bacterium]|nr:hypothetical protein [Polyangiaceae bacterium]